jgi:type II secretion system protein J
MERVSYSLVGTTLQRSYQTVLDPTANNQPVVQDLLTGVTSIQFRFLDTNQAWNTQWPPATLPLPDSEWTRPVAVEIVIEFKDWGHIRRLVEIAG